MTTGERLRNIRNEQHFSRRELSACSGVAEDSIKQYESGRRKPRIEQIRLLSAALGVSPAYLLGYEDGSIADLTKGETEIKELGYTEAAAKALAQQIAIESQLLKSPSNPLVFGERLDQRCTEIGISLSDLSVLTGIAKETIERYAMEDVYHIKIADIIPIAKALKTSPDYLIGRTDEAEKEPTKLSPVHVDTGDTYVISTSSINETLSEMAEDELIKEERQICGYDKKMNDSDLQRVWNPERISIITKFIKRNSEMLRAQMDILKSEQKE